MMEALNQQQTKIESNLEATQTQIANLENVNISISDENSQNSDVDNDEADKEEEPQNHEEQGNDGDDDDVATNELTTKDDSTENIENVQNCNQVATTAEENKNIIKENNEHINEEELLKSDEEEDADEQENNNEGTNNTNASEIDEMTLEKEEELLKSDDEDTDKIIKSTTISEDEAEYVNNIVENRDKEIVTISDEDETTNEQSIPLEPEAATPTTTTIAEITTEEEDKEIENNLDLEQQQNVNEEIINLADDDDDESQQNVQQTQAAEQLDEQDEQQIQSDQDSSGAKTQKGEEVEEKEEEKPKEKILYKFDIADDSSCESDYKEVPRAEPEEESHDTFASFNDGNDDDDDNEASRSAPVQEQNDDSTIESNESEKQFANENESDDKTTTQRASLEKSPTKFRDVFDGTPKINGDLRKSPALLLLTETESKSTNDTDTDEHVAVINFVDKSKENQIVNNNEVFSINNYATISAANNQHDNNNADVNNKMDAEEDDDECDEEESADNLQIALETPHDEHTAAESAKMKGDTDNRTQDCLNSSVQTQENTAETAEREHINDEYDNASRCSSVASSISSSTTATSSSRLLVIDHPMEDLDTVAGAAAAAAPPTAHQPPTLPVKTLESRRESSREEEARIVAPLKLTLKRKLSNSEEYLEIKPPQEKQQHLDSSSEEETELRKVNYLDNNSTLQLNTESYSATGAAAVEEEEEEEVHTAQNDVGNSLSLMDAKCEEANLVLPLESLLLQQLKKPQMLLPSPPSTQLAAPSTPAAIRTDTGTEAAEFAAPSVMQTAETPPKSTTKYLCFKCKIGSFATLEELNLHQVKCLTNGMSFLPIQQQQHLLPATTTASCYGKSSTLLTHNNVVQLQAAAEEVSPTTTSTTPTNNNNNMAVSVEKKCYYKCSSCGTYHENWNLFLHIREKHNRHMCVYCIRFFPTAEKLSLHLEIKHDLEQNHFNSEDALRKSVMSTKEIALQQEEQEQSTATQSTQHSTRFLMCCTCEHVFEENAPFSDHICTEFMNPCTLCGQKGRHSNQCKAHPDAKRSNSKMKKKKERLAASMKATATKLAATVDAAAAAPLVAVPNSYCDENAHKMPAVNASSSSTLLPQHNEDSNMSSCSSNMVIDESCNTNHNDHISLVNPFKTLEHQHERLGMMSSNEASLLYARSTALNSPKQSLLVPKLKLRVPKEFQKSVDAAFSSTESEEDDEDENENEEQQDMEQAEQMSETEQDASAGGADKDLNVDVNSSTITNNSNTIDSNSTTESVAADATITQEDNTTDGVHASYVDDDSVDEPNSNLMRILQEIERTKMDIQRTKETLHHVPKLTAAAVGSDASTSPPSKSLVTQQQSTLAAAEQRNWSPTTPPASPKISMRPADENYKTDNSSTTSTSAVPIATTSDEATARSDSLLTSVPQVQEQQPQAQEEEQQQPQAQEEEQQPQPQSQEEVHEQQQIQSRRLTAGSDAMDIDETITCGQQMSNLQQDDNNKMETLAESAANVDAQNSSIESEIDATAAGEEATADTNAENINIEQDSNAEMMLSTAAAANDITKEEEEAMELDADESSQPANIADNLLTLTATATKEDVDDEEEDLQIDVDVVMRPEEMTAHKDITSPATPMPTAIETSLPPPPPPADGIEVANEDSLIVDLQLDRPLDKFEVVEFVRICLKTVYPLCLYCNHARRIAVNGKNLVLHMIAQHRFSATVDSITAEELKPDTIVTKLKSFLSQLEHEYFNASSYCTMGEGVLTQPINERIFECFQCRFMTSTHKELYLHNRKMHLKTAILCHMCRANFFSFSEILCHICPGAANHTPVFDVKFRCCLCPMDNIPSPFRLMVHLRKKHNACDVCLEDCRDQGRLSSHVWKHKLHHLCYRCGIAYRNKTDIMKHLFWKHGTESIICKRCLQKRWRHVYHFCVPPVTFVCEVCNLCFSKAMYLKVHKRLHSDDLRYPCSEEDCEKKFISRTLLLKHQAEHQEAERQAALKQQEKLEQANEGETKQNSSENAETTADLVKSEHVEIKQESTAEPPTKDDGVSGLGVGIKKETTSDITKTECKTENTEAGNSKSTEETKLADKLNTDKPRKKRKKNKRSKESLEDLNLIAPNLSESDSSDGCSDADSKSRDDEESELVPRVMLSPPSEAENDSEKVGGDRKAEEELTSAATTAAADAVDMHSGNTDDGDGTGKVLEIWKNFLQAQQATGNKVEVDQEAVRTEANYSEDNYPQPTELHVAYSDHDYCAMIRPKSPKIIATAPPPTKKTAAIAKSPNKRTKSGKSPRRSTTLHSDADGSSSSSDDDSSSSSASSCSCGSNCSCSSSGGSSSSSSSDDSDTSAASNASPTRKTRHRKKSERDRMRKKSLSVSPTKKHHNNSLSEPINVVDGEDDEERNRIAAVMAEAAPPSPPKEPVFYECDLETAESETDEEFYDEHPQKLASELLAQKRAQLMAQTRLSPSHNYDIVENSRPSTPSLPEEVAARETTKVRSKKKKRDRKSSNRNSGGAGTLPTLKLNLSGKAPALTLLEQHSNIVQQQQPISAEQLTTYHHYHHHQPEPNMQLQQMSVAPPPPQYTYAPLAVTTPTNTAAEQMTLTPRPIGLHPHGRVSEGSSCSDPDASLKRSKRARRPNKFYGYTSDDENMSMGQGQTVMMGIHAIKPQPPPQLTWRKEDLPTPSKSILNSSKSKTPRTPKMPITPGAGQLFNSGFGGLSTQKKKKRPLDSAAEKSVRRTGAKRRKLMPENRLPPIPTLKIRATDITRPPLYASSRDSDDEDSSGADSSTDDDFANQQMQQLNALNRANTWNTALNMQTPKMAPPLTKLALQQALPAPPPPIIIPQPPPTPQTTAFNHKIPPALLPNPDFATLQYFKANNIRYPIRPPAGARQPREGESVYCYCRCPYDEVSEMIACDGANCLIEWFHFECVGIMVAPQGKWFCAECRPQYSEELYPTTNANSIVASNTTAGALTATTTTQSII